MSSLLEVTSLRVLYQGSITGISGVTLNVNAGQAVSILGANGAGKSTTLRAITGFIGHDNARIADGHVNFNGAAITNLLPHRIAQMGIALVPERDKVFPNLTVAENLTVVAGGKGPVAEMIYGFFPRLAQLRSKLAGLLSGGERQMLAIGAALAFQPRLLLIDELSLGLAPIIVEDIATRLAEIRRQLNLSLLLVEQNAHMALRLADYAYVLENGRVALEGRAADLRGNPDVQHLYLGGHAGERRSYRDIAMEETR
jgi:branched-chain amino acid transport system ATP-binding protein